MKHSSDLLVEADATTVIDALADLSTYPAWNDLVSSASPTAAFDGDQGPAWLTTLRAQVGPFARSKQLRFVRDDQQPSHNIRFIRREIDGRDHAQWLMEASVEPADAGSKITLTLTYDGGLWVPALGGILGGAIERATTRLPSYLESR